MFPWKYFFFVKLERSKEIKKRVVCIRFPPMFPCKYFSFMKLKRSEEIKRELFALG
jgi:hypothetical protein